jgi:hypothetical protein
VIADQFQEFHDYIEDNPEYEELPNGLFARTDSVLISMEGLGKEYR